jgi:release factor glutamine methyltransferase
MFTPHSNTLHTLATKALDQLTPLYGATEARALLRALTEDIWGITPNQWHTHTLHQPTQINQWNHAIARLLRSEPIQYITHTAWFYGLRLHVTPAVLIPRPETEELVEWILADTPNTIPRRVLDIGTGSGCIPIALAHQRPNWHLWALDISAQALQIATQNAHQHHTNIHFLHADILAPDTLQILPDQLHILVSNPPYIPHAEKTQMAANVLQYEPHQALFVPDQNALLFYNQIAQIALQKLHPDGYLYLEINEYQATQTATLLNQYGFKNIHIQPDINGKHRMIRATL